MLRAHCAQYHRSSSECLGESGSARDTTRTSQHGCDPSTHPSAVSIAQRSPDSRDPEWKLDPIRMLRIPSFFPPKPLAQAQDRDGRRSIEMEWMPPILLPEISWARTGSADKESPQSSRAPGPQCG